MAIAAAFIGRGGFDSQYAAGTRIRCGCKKRSYVAKGAMCHEKSRPNSAPEGRFRLGGWLIRGGMGIHPCESLPPHPTG
eukprot:1181306-Prorocentrum_minimum.AAC.1